MNGEIEDGVFTDGRLSGVVFKWSPKRNQYSKLDYSGRETVLLEKGEGDPLEKILEMK